MSIAFCSFVKRDDQGDPILDFTFWHGSVRLKIGRKSVKHMNCVEYTEEEFNAIDFESLDSTPCAFWAYKCCEYVEAFQLADDKFASMLISRKDVSEFMKHDVSTAWVALCKQYDPTLEGRIAAELARRMNILQPKREPELPEHFNEDFLREYTNTLLSGLELILSDDDLDKLQKIADECIKDFLEHPELNPYNKLDFSPVISQLNSADYSGEKGGTSNDTEKEEETSSP